MTDYDAWLQKPYHDMYDREETRSFNCAENNELSEDAEENEGGLPYCDFDGEVDCYIESSKGRGWWEIKYIGKCPKCERSLIHTESDCRENHETDY